MSQPEDPLREKSDPTSQSQIQPAQTSDQECQKQIEQRRAPDTQAMRSAKAQIDSAIDVIRQYGDRQPSAPLRKLPPVANLRSPGQAGSRPRNTSAPPTVDHFAGIEPRSPSDLDPEILAPPPENPRRLGRMMIRSTQWIGFAAIVAYGITMFSSFQTDNRLPKSSNDGASIGPMSRESGNDARQRLVVEDRQAFANEPIWLGAVADPAASSGALSLRGLAHGTRLSAGLALDEDGWELALRDIDRAYVYAPSDFVGVMDATIALLSPAKMVIDSRQMRLEWMAKVDSLPNKQEMDLGSANGVPKRPVDAGPPGLIAKLQIDSGTVNATAVRPLDQQQAASLMERGRELLKSGDVALAQLAFRRVAEAGNADAALALATTYDPRCLAERKLVGIVGDEAKARVWYQRAKELGSVEADCILRPTSTK
jgi:hypothetical protein